MVSIVNASPTNGIVQTADGSGVMKLQSNGVTTNALAWVSFDNNGTIRSAYNVGSVTKNGTGDYTVNFSSALADANYASIGSASPDSAPAQAVVVMDFAATSNTNVAPTTTALRLSTTGLAAARAALYVNIAVFGN